MAAHRHGGTVTVTTDPGYVLGAEAPELARLLFQAELHRVEATWLLDRVALPAGGRAVDLGCGPLGIMDLLAEQVGPTGEVVGVDNEPRMLTLATRVLADRGLAGVRLVEADATATGLEPAAFELAHARLVLVNVRQPEAVVAEMARLVRPGGAVAVQDTDWISWTCLPAHPAWDRVRDALAAFRAARGLDVGMGRRLPGLLEAAGLVDVQAEGRVRFFRSDHPYQTLLLTFARLHADAMVADGLVGGDELDELVGQLERHLADPATVTVYATHVMAWGRRPA